MCFVPTSRSNIMKAQRLSVLAEDQLLGEVPLVTERMRVPKLLAAVCHAEVDLVRGEVNENAQRHRQLSCHGRA
jgi:hypothetical protein